MTKTTRDELIRLRQALARECAEKAVANLTSPHYWLWIGQAKCHEQRAAELQQEAAQC